VLLTLPYTLLTKVENISKLAYCENISKIKHLVITVVIQNDWEQSQLVNVIGTYLKIYMHSNQITYFWVAFMTSTGYNFI
jgi:metal-responsive CopG/Arc/MetJ family transcriptional regulator